MRRPFLRATVCLYRTHQHRSTPANGLWREHSRGLDSASALKPLACAAALPTGPGPRVLRLQGITQIYTLDTKASTNFLNVLTWSAIHIEVMTMDRLKNFKERK